MQITRNNIETGAGPKQWFTGAVYVDTIAAPSSTSHLSASSVHFSPGARTAWHTHPNGLLPPPTGREEVVHAGNVFRQTAGGRAHPQRHGSAPRLSGALRASEAPSTSGGCRTKPIWKSDETLLNWLASL